ncbi:MAG: S41 family peptidase [Clostridiales bacterium]|nr:S41 family peptidase [Clostridiales bacterium]MDY3746277.1 S41 family peptidase [Lachnospiraceae bacterium]
MLKRKGYTKKCILAAVTAMAVLLGGCGMIDRYLTVDGDGMERDNATVLDENKAERYAAIEKKLDELDQVIDRYYLNEEDIDTQALEDGIMKGYIEGLDEKYTTYYTEEEYQSLIEETTGEYDGVGMMVSQNMDTMQITVITVFEGSPAEEAGLKQGDILYKVEDEEIGNKEVSLVVKDIKGEPGTWVNVTVYRPDEDAYIDLKMERRRIETPTVSYEMLDDQIGYIYITSFESVTVGQFTDAVKDLQSRNMKGLIIDLRNNPGGMLTSVCQILDTILPKDQLLVYTIDKNGKKEETRTENDDELNLPMAVVVNDQSASASEIFTAAMQDYEKAVIVGETTFGKGIVQVIIPLSDGSAVKVTTSKYYTPKGECIHEIGVTPDIEVELDKDSETDTQLDAAIEAVKNQIK